MKFNKNFINLLFAITVLSVSSISTATQHFTTKSGTPAILEVVANADALDLATSRKILVAAFSTEYAQYLAPEEISPELKFWKHAEGEPSVEQYYENYFEEELRDLASKKVVWVQAKIASQVVGWATFSPDASRPNAVYMNLLVVHPSMQGQGIGKQLVFSPVTMQIFPEPKSLHLLLRKKNQGGRIFYGKLGFFFDQSYQRSDNFVDISLLEPWSIKLATEG